MGKRSIIQLLLVFSPLIFFAQQHQRNNFKIICYNVENYFDIVDDSLTNDQEFLPNGLRGWTYAKYQQKQANIAKVITAIGGWEPPAIVGLCEIESRKGLIDLTRYSVLKSLKYKFLHHESPDARGVDVALLYQPSQFKPFHDEALAIHFPTSPGSKTRDILFASGIVPSGDTLHLFVCHFPSRLGGELESENKRIFVASVLRAKVDSLFKTNLHPKIVIMGDFNDYPTNRSIIETVAAQAPTNTVQPKQLYNLMYQLHKSGKGTNKHSGEWGALDQIIISGALLDNNKRLNTREEDVHIFEADFLLENDTQFLGKQPFRTYVGMKYHGGFSDHLPIYADFWYATKP
jgi:endonuclease/exonuclease/phosphatase family metal-dependent hydrolase